MARLAKRTGRPPTGLADEAVVGLDLSDWVRRGPPGGGILGTSKKAGLVGASMIWGVKGEGVMVMILVSARGELGPLIEDWGEVQGDCSMGVA